MTDRTLEMLKKATIELAKERERNKNLKKAINEPIAIIGMSCRFPGARNLEEFWDMLVRGRDGISEVPSNRWNIDEYYDSNTELPGKIYVRKGGFIQEIENFDAEFFGISPREALMMDPQQRHILELTWHAFENAYLPIKDYCGKKVGVFIGIGANEYSSRILSQGNELLNIYFATGNALNVIAGRLAYAFGFNGPTEVIDTACSSSLVALNHACLSLQSHTSDLAVCGGVNMIISPQSQIALCQAKMLADDGYCKTFDASANGYSRGEGCGVVILKRLSDALKDNNRIWAVVDGTAVNHGGKTSGLTVPNGEAQQEVIKLALKKAQLKPCDIDYIEAHGTGTSLGDPLELNALGNVYGNREEGEFFYVSTVKTYVGHLESAAGIASVIKVALSLKNELIPKHLHFNEINPNINLKQIKAKIPFEKPITWKKNKNSKRRAGISSFGFSGINSHIIMEEAPDKTINLSEYENDKNKYQLITLTAKNESSLLALKRSYINYLNSTTKKLAAISFAGLLGREHFSLRIAVIGSSKNEIITELKKAAIVKTHNKSREILLFDNDSDQKIQLNTTELTKLTIEKYQNNLNLLRNLFEKHDIENLPKKHWHQIIKILKNIYLDGIDIDWRGLLYTQNIIYDDLNLPTYCFDKKRFWLDDFSTSIIDLDRNTNQLLTQQILIPNEKGIIFETEINYNRPEFVSDHIIYDKPVIAGAVYISAIISAVKTVYKKNTIELRNIEFIKPMVLTNKKSRIMQIYLAPQDDMTIKFSITSRYKNDLNLKNVIQHAVGEIYLDGHITNQSLDIMDIRNRCPLVYTAANHKDFTEKLSLKLGHHFSWVQEVNYNDKELLAQLRYPEAVEANKYDLYPGFIDSCFQASLAWLYTSKKKRLLTIPLSIKKYLYKIDKFFPCYVYFKNDSEKLDINSTFSLVLLNETGLILGEASGLRVREVSEKNLLRIIQSESYEKSAYKDWLYQVTWSQERIKSEASNQYGNKWVWLHEPITRHNITDILANIKDDAEPHGIILNFTSSFSEKTFNKVMLEPLFELINQSNVAELLILAQAIKDYPRLSIVILTNNTLNLDAAKKQKQINLINSPLNGFIRTWALEEPYRKIFQIDFDHKIEKPQEKSVKNIIDDCLSTDHSQHVIRNQEHYIPYLTPVTLRTKNTIKLHANAYYLITGGLGGIGLELAKWLVAKGAKNIILASRKPIKENQIKELKEITSKAKASIKAVKLDVCDADAVDNFFKNYSDVKSKPLKGIFHLAGVIEDKMISHQVLNHFIKVFSPKIQGSWNLHKASIKHHINLDYFILFSSISSVLGSLGQSNYAAGNSFLDALVYYRRVNKLPAITINWGLWDKVGMGTRIDRTQNIAVNRIPPNQALEAMESVLEEYKQITIAHVNWDKLVKTGSAMSIFSKLINTEEQTAPTLLNVLTELEPNQREAYLVNYLGGVIQSILQLRDSRVLTDDVGFFTIGMDSLMAVSLINHLQAVVGPKHHIPHTLVFDYSNIKDLSNKLLDILNLKQVTHVKFKNKITSTGKKDPIAIIGISCRFPGGADNADLFWELLNSKYDGIIDVPNDRWDVDDYYDPDPKMPGKTQVKKAGFLSCPVDEFDIELFKLNATVAKMMDPQQRLLLEVAWEALEDAAIAPTSLKNTRTGIFVGAWRSDYEDLIARDLKTQGINTYTSATTLSALSGSLAFTFGTNGPSYVVDTACSSSLTALDGAIKSLREGEIDLALVCGVNLLLAPEYTIALDKAGMLSPDGYCKTFDAKANGYARGEGIGVVVLKHASEACTDRDSIYAQIKSVSINHNGPSSAMTVPNGLAQAALISQGLEKAEISAEDIDYLEAHGTGTQLGDPIEINAIQSVFQNVKSKENPLYIGSVKTNIGHLEAAAGIAGLIKTALILNYKTIPANIHFTKPNPKINLAAIPAIVPKENVSLKENKRIYAGVSSFGATGVNAHVVLEEPPEIKLTNHAKIKDRNIHLLCISSLTIESLNNLIIKYIAFFSRNKQLNLSDIAYTLNVGRTHLQARFCLIVSNIDQLISALKNAKPKYLLESNKEFIPIYYDVSQGWQLSLDKIANKVKTNHQTFFKNFEMKLKNKHPWEVSETDWQKIFTEISDLFMSGVGIDWDGLENPFKIFRTKLHLPTYAFNNKKYWYTGERIKPEIKETKSSNIISKPNEYNSQIDYHFEIIPYIATMNKEETSNLKLETYEPRWQAAPLNQFNNEKNNFNMIIYDSNEIFFNKNTCKQLLPKGTIKLIKNLSVDSINRLFKKEHRLKIIFTCEPVSYEDSEMIMNSLKEFFIFLQDISKLYKDNYIEIYIIDGNARKFSLLNSYSCLLKSVNNEIKRISAKLIFFDKKQTQIIKFIASEIIESPAGVEEIYYQNNVRKIKQIQPIQHENQRIDLKKNGTYIVTGGHQGIGYLIAYACAKKQNINLILLGRSKLNNHIKEKIKEIEKTKSKAEYVSVDIINIHELKRIIKSIINKYKKINGIIHSAGVIDDSLFLLKNNESIEKVLNPKIYGALYLDQLTKNENLDFFVNFSSLSAIAGNVSQTDYAMANGFLNDFVLARNSLVENKERHGHSIAINWPYWSQGGMQINPVYLKTLKRKFGIYSLNSEQGVQIFFKLLSLSSISPTPLYGDQNKIPNIFANKITNNVKLKIKHDKYFYEKIYNELIIYLKKLFSEQFSIDAENLVSNKNLYEYGLDSIILQKIYSKFDEQIWPIDINIFLENHTLENIAKKIIDNHCDEFYHQYRTNKDNLEIKADEFNDLLSKTKLAIIPSEKSVSVIKLTDVSNLKKKFINLYLKPIVDLNSKISRNECYIDIKQNVWIFMNYKSSNLFDLEMMREILSCYQFIEKNFPNKTKAIYLTHKNEVFSYGGDRKLFLELARTRNYNHIDEYVELSKKLFSDRPLNKIIIGIAAGNAFGGGLEFLLACDFQFVLSGIKLGVPEIFSGLFPGMGGTSYLQALAGDVIAKRMNILGELISAEMAHEKNIITHISENPFIDAYEFYENLPNVDAALEIIKIHWAKKSELMSHDLDAWGNFLKKGGFTKLSDKIANDYKFIEKLDQKTSKTSKNQ